MLLASPAQAQVGNVTGDLGDHAPAVTGQMIGASGACTRTPQRIKVTIFEMGLCTTHPFQRSSGRRRFNRDQLRYHIRRRGTC